MPIFKKKPIIVEAVQWEGTAASFDAIRNLGCNWKPGEMGTYTFHLETLNGFVLVTKWEWVIKGVNGECYPCMPDIFENTYELVND